MRRLLTMVLFVPLFAAGSGCGGDDSSTAPDPVVKAMAGIQITSDQVNGVPFPAAVVVSVDGQAVTDAVVKINGADLTYVDTPSRPETTGYLGAVPGSPGDLLTLTVTASGKTVQFQATIPGPVAIQSPETGAAFADAADVPLTWTPAAGASMTVVTCGGAQSTAPGMWLLPPTATAYAVPAAATAAPACRISVRCLNGSGEMPTSIDMRDWVGKSGFWVSSEDNVDVLITS